MRNKKFVSLLLAGALCTAHLFPVSADYESDLLEEASRTQAELEATYGYIDDLYYQKAELEYQGEILNDSIYNCMVAIEVLKQDINVKEGEIANTEGQIEKAENAVSEQYSSMKSRIQLLYEKGGDEAWLNLMLNAENVADFLNRAEYTQQMYEADREALQKYSNTVSAFNTLVDRYEGEKAELEGMQSEYEAAEAELEYELAVVRDNIYGCEDEIAYAQYLAQEKANYLVEVTEEYNRVVAERIAWEQAEAERIAREQAEAEAAAAAAAAAAEAEEEIVSEENAVQALVQSGMNEEEFADALVDSGMDAEEAQEVIESLTVYDEDGAAVSALEAASSGAAVFNSDGEEVSASSVVEAAASSSGQSVVDFATQFVGNPYVWGGTSLTNGADCSGFAQSVYSNFGVDLPRTSYEQESAGTSVSSLEEAQPGDLICYGSHVAIYMGDGQIVHASNETDGIKISDNAAYRTITSIRRLV